MLPYPTTLLLLAALATRSFAGPLATRQAPAPVAGFFNSSSSTGSWLTIAQGTFPAGLGEPINVVISAASDPFILTDPGFFDFMLSLDQSGECLGMSSGSKQQANLGDGNGALNQSGILRHNFGDPIIGTCRQSFLGGNHARWWVQNGTLAPTGAYFLAASNELDLAANHMIAPNGYDDGRDWLTGNATIAGGTKSSVTNRTFETTSMMVSGFLKANSSEGVNHGIETDGDVAVWEVRVTSNETALGIAAGTGGAEGTGVRVLRGAVGVAAVALAALWI